MGKEPRGILAPNPGPMTVDGTWSWIVGHGACLLIDPGPDVEAHVRALVRALSGETGLGILHTHGHEDHVGATPLLLRALEEKNRVSVRSVRGPGARDGDIADGEPLPFEGGSLIACSTPGHTLDHLSFLDPDSGDLFCGDLLLGSGDTTWVGAYPGCIADYLNSLDLIEALAPRRILPAHGPAIPDPGNRIRRFRAHRMRRISEVEHALRRHPGATSEELALAIHGPRLPAPFRGPAIRTIEMTLVHLDRTPGRAFVDTPATGGESEPRGGVSPRPRPGIPRRYPPE